MNIKRYSECVTNSILLLLVIVYSCQYYTIFDIEYLHQNRISMSRRLTLELRWIFIFAIQKKCLSEEFVCSTIYVTSHMCLMFMHMYLCSCICLSTFPIYFLWYVVTCYVSYLLQHTFIYFLVLHIHKFIINVTLIILHFSI